MLVSSRTLTICIYVNGVFGSYPPPHCPLLSPHSLNPYFLISPPHLCVCPTEFNYRYFHEHRYGVICYNNGFHHLLKLLTNAQGSSGRCSLSFSMLECWWAQSCAGLLWVIMAAVRSWAGVMSGLEESVSRLCSPCSSPDILFALCSSVPWALEELTKMPHLGMGTQPSLSTLWPVVSLCINCLCWGLGVWMQTYFSPLGDLDIDYWRSITWVFV